MISVFPEMVFFPSTWAPQHSPASRARGLGDARGPWGPPASLWQGLGHAGSQEGYSGGGNTLSSNTASLQGAGCPGQRQGDGHPYTAGGEALMCSSAITGVGRISVPPAFCPTGMSAPGGSRWIRVPKAVCSRAPIRVSSLRALGERAGGCARACVEPCALALHRSSRRLSGLLLISVWEENECCSCTIIPTPSRLSSAQRRGAGARVRLPACLVATG